MSRTRESTEPGCYEVHGISIRRCECNDQFFQLGDHVLTRLESKSGEVKFVGEASFTEGIVVGIALDRWDPLAHEGVIRGLRYFHCSPGRGMFARPESLSSIAKIEKHISIAIRGASVIMLNAKKDKFKWYPIQGLQLPCDIHSVVVTISEKRDCIYVSGMKGEGKKTRKCSFVIELSEEYQMKVREALALFPEDIVTLLLEYAMPGTFAGFFDGKLHKNTVT